VRFGRPRKPNADQAHVAPGCLPKEHRFGVPMNRISAIVNGKRAITVDTAMRLARYFGTSPQYWLNLQNAYHLETADRAEIEKKVLPRNAA
jgi:plasmid maintenance system antidote protein VapI